MKKITVLFSCLIFLLPAYSQIDISSARAMSLGSTVTVKGIITNGPELGAIRYMQDLTGGIAVYDFAMMDGVLRGDSVIVSGVLTDYNQLLEIQPVNSVTVINSGNPLPEGVSLTISAAFNESYEAQLIQINDVSFVDMGSFSTSSANYDITDGSNTEEVRINGTSNIAGTLIPDEAINIIGIMSQFDFSDPSSGYQLLPRDLPDFETAGNPPVISSALVQSDLSTNSFTVSFETLNNGNTIIYYGSSESLGSVTSSADLTTDHSIELSGLEAGEVYFLQAASVSITGDTSYSSVNAMATVSNSSGDIKVYFTHPVDQSVSSGTNATYLNGTLDDTLRAYIDRAKYSIDMAIYNFDNDLFIVNALNDAFARGVNVRLIANEGVNSSAYNSLNIGSGNKLKSPSGTTPTGDFYGLMHNKFILIDAESSDPMDPLLWTGSTNFTSNQLLQDVNNVIIIQDQSLARSYLVEFNEMFNGDFGTEKSENTPKEFLIDGKRVELYFSPTEEVEQRIKDAINTADHDLYFSVFNWTRFGISYEVEDMVEAGAFAAGIIEDIDTLSLEWTILREAMGPTLFLDNQPFLFHHKYLLVDPTCENADPMVLTGSSNFSSNGTSRSDENILIIHDEETANIYYQEFVQRYKDNGGEIFVEDDPSCKIVSSIEDIQENEVFKLYPNPASDYVLIELNDDGQEYVLSVVNLMGQIIETKNSRDLLTRLDLNNYIPGLYIIRVENQEGIFTQSNLIVVD